MTTMTEPTTQHPRGARRRRSPTTSARTDASGEPVLLLIGSPMGAGGFGTLAGHFPDRTVVTYDPRGVERSTKADPASAVDARAARRRPASDHRRRSAAGPVDLFASSGGAVNALALVAAHPERRPDARRARAAARLGPARSRGRAGGLPRRSTTRTSAAGSGRAWRSSSLVVSHQGPIDAEFAGAAGARSGDVRAADRGRRHPHRPAARPEHHRPAPTTSPTSTPCARPRPGSSSPPARSRRARWRTAAREAVAERLGTEPVIFPSDHGGFLGGEYGQAGEPDAFAAKLREVLAEA